MGYKYRQGGTPDHVNSTASNSVPTTDLKSGYVVAEDKKSGYAVADRKTGYLVAEKQ